MDQKSGKTSQKRRAILQGSLAAPVVLTVASPTAAASSFARCIRNLPNDPPSGTLLFLDAWDGKSGFWRVSRPVVQFANPSGNGVNATDWLYNDPNLGYVSVNDPFTPVKIPDGWLQSGSSNRWLLAWFDKDGNPGPYQVQRPFSFKASTVSCHTSFTSGSGK